MLGSIVTALAGCASLVAGASLTQVSNFGDNLSKINMYIYVPDKVATSPAVIVAVSGLRQTRKMIL